MNSRKLLTLVLAVALAAAAWQLTRSKAPTRDLESSPLYPQLLESINDTSRLEIISAGDRYTLKREGERWLLTDRDNFPAQTAAVKELLLQIAGLRLREEKTSKPDNYQALGVEPVETPKATSQEVKLYGKGDAVLADLLVGKARKPRGTEAPGHFVRRQGESTAWLVEGELEVKTKRNDWLDTGVVNLPVERVRKVTLSPAGKPPVEVVKKSRKEQLFTLSDVPAGKDIKSVAMVSNVGALLMETRFEEVAGARSVEGQQPIAVARVETFDGLVATVTAYSVKEKTWVALRFEHQPALAEPAATPPAPAAAEQPQPTPESEKPADVAAEVQRLNTQTAPWVYQLADYKSRTLTRTLEDFIKPKEKAPLVSPTP